jgi:spore germination protein YaaH
MRDKYIELIKEYIKQKPEYKEALHELKSEVLLVGATEDEFDEAIRQITEPFNGMESNLNSDFILENTVQPQSYSRFSEYHFRLKNLGNFTKKHLGKRKKYVVGIAFAIVLLFGVTQVNFNKPVQKETIVNKSTATKVAAEKGPIPVVYANVQPVDPEKIFSIKSSNVALTITGKPKKEVLGFFPYWMLPKQQEVNLNMLTSVALFGLEVDGAGNIVTNANDAQAAGGWNMWRSPDLDMFVKRAKGQGIKVYLTFKSFNSSNIDALAKSDTAQKSFIANAMYLVNSKNLDGINIDFEYVGIPSDEVRDGFTRLITNLNTELKRQIPKASLSIDTYLVSGSERGIFNVSVLAQNLDAFVIMGYDMHTPLGDPGPVSAMGGGTNIIGYVQNYLEKVDASKIILAVPYYGYDWPTNPDSSQAVKILPYAQIAESSKNTSLSWDETSQTPFFTYREEGVERVVHFDNVRSLAIKYDFINSKNLKGVGLWALGYDGQNQDLEKLLIDKFINK